MAVVGISRGRSDAQCKQGNYSTLHARRWPGERCQCGTSSKALFGPKCTLSLNDEGNPLILKQVRPPSERTTSSIIPAG